MPVGIGEQIVGAAGTAVEIAVGFVDDQGDATAAAEIAEGGEGFRRILDAAGVVGADQHNGTGTRGDQALGGFGFGDQACACGEGHGFNPLHIQPHFMVEIPRRRQDHLIACACQSGQSGAEGLIAALGDCGLAFQHAAAVGL